MNLDNRLKKLEEQTGMNERYKYMCVITEGWAKCFNTPEENAGQFKIQPCIPSFGGNGDKAFYLPSYEDLKAFAKRPDVDLTIIVAGREPEENQTTGA